jgi:hypothetical protein
MIDRPGTSGGGKLLRRLVASAAALAAVGIGVIAFSSPASASVSGRVITPAGSGLNVRSAANTSAGILRSVPSGSYVSFSCYVQGEAVAGPYGTETLWDQLDDGGYASDAWIYTGSNSAVVPQCSSPQPPPPSQGGNQYLIAWTGGLGVYPRTSTSMSASKVSPALGEGAVVTLSCETTGETVTDTAGSTSSLWDQLNTGYYVSNAYINTGTNGRTPGVQDCAAASGGSSGGTSGGSPSKYDGAGAAAWARLNWNKHPRYPADDCTWLVSQALWKGGMKKDAVWTDDTLTDPAQPRLAKYHIYGPSRTAAQANALFQYLISHHLAEPRLITWSDNTAGGAKIGDIIAYDWNGVADPNHPNINHLAIITGFKGTYPLRSQHSEPRLDVGWSWDPGDPATHAPSGWIQYTHPGSLAWLLHITY